MSGPLSKEEWAVARRLSTDSMQEIIAGQGIRKALLGYQARTVALLEDTACKVLFVEKSRRIGLTWGFASYAALRAARAKNAGGMDVMYISYSQEMTREFIDACAMWARNYSLAAMEMEETFFEDNTPEGDRSIQAFRIRFASGFEVLALSSAPRTLRGKQGVVMIDEAAFVDSLPELLKAALAFLMWGGQVVVCSTHNGSENEFNVQVQNILGGRSKYKHVHIDFDEALEDGLYERICLVTHQEWSPEAEAQWREDIIDFYGDGADEELFCIPSMGSGAWLTAPLIEARMNSDGPVLRLDLPTNFLHLPKLERDSLMAPFLDELRSTLEGLDSTLMHAFGFDFARVADLSVGVLLEIGKTLHRRSALTIELRGVPGDEQKQIVREILAASPRLVGAAFDATGMGWTVAEDMGRIFGLRDKESEGGLVHAIKFSQDWYRVNMPPLKTAFEDAAISVSKDAEHMGDLRLVKVIRGIPMVPDARTGEGNKKRHGDFAIGLALAHFASRMQWHEYAYVSVPVAAGRYSETQSDDDRPFRMASLKLKRGGY